ncbi:phytanoyl-CoA dioxygenase family protein [Klebsiella aerogenes]|nr:phytanoyl-CoA dioxygenase family protein [Klebsiella aerogenes]
MNITQDIKQNGYAVLPNLLSKSDAKTLLKEIGGSYTSSDLYVFKEDLLRLFPEIVLPIIINSLVLDSAESIMGPFVQLDSISLVCLPKKSKCELSWHRDPYGGFPRGSAFQRPLALNLLVYLQDLDNEIGPLRVIPGSHRRKLKIDEKERNKEHHLEELIFAKTGDGVLIHNNLIHTRSRNISHLDRYHLSVVYNLSIMKSMLNTNLPHIKDIITCLNEIGDIRLMRLFGQDAKNIERNNSGFLIEDEIQWRRWLDIDRMG